MTTLLWFIGSTIVLLGTGGPPPTPNPGWFGQEFFEGQFFNCKFFNRRG